MKSPRLVDAHGPAEVDHPVNHGYLADVLELHHVWADKKRRRGHP